MWFCVSVCRKEKFLTGGNEIVRSNVHDERRNNSRCSFLPFSLLRLRFLSLRHLPLSFFFDQSKAHNRSLSILDTNRRPKQNILSTEREEDKFLVSSHSSASSVYFLFENEVVVTNDGTSLLVERQTGASGCCCCCIDQRDPVKLLGRGRERKGDVLN